MDKPTYWTELLEREWVPLGYQSMIEAARANGHTDKEICELLESFG